MLATSVPVAVVPSAPRWPSWKIHTSAPNAAVSDNTLSTNAFSGSTTLPVSRNSSTKVIDRDHTQHQRAAVDVIACRAVAVDLRHAGQLHRLAAGGGTACSRSSWASERVGEQRRGAADGQERAAVLRSRSPPRAARRARRRRTSRPARTPTTRREPGTAPRRSGRDRAGVTPAASGITTVTLVAESTAKSLRSSSPTWRADADCGSTRSSGKPHLTPRNGAPSSSSNATTARPIGIARRITNFVQRYQNVCSTGLRHRLGPTEQPADQPAHVQRVEPVAEQHDRRGRHHDRGDGRERHHGDARIGERLQEVHREQHHRDHRQRDRHRREQHRPARGGHRADQRLVALRPGGQLVAVPADDQQRVVDGERQTHGDGQVQREDRHVGDEGDRAQHRHRARGSRSRRRPAAAPRRAGRRTPRPAPGSSAGSRSIPSAAGRFRSGR